MKKYLTLLLSFGLILTFTGCTDNANNINPDAGIGRLQIVATSFPLYEFSKQVGGDHADVRLLLPPGVEPHSFEPKPSDVVAVSNADLFVMSGAGLEPWADDLLSGIDGKVAKFVAADYSDLLPADDNSDGVYDPHLWLNFENDVKIVTALGDEMARLDPANSTAYKSNASSYVSRLRSLDADYSASLSNCDKHTFITGGHNAYRYLAARYGLDSVSAYGLSPDSEPTPRQLKELTDISREQGIGYILFEELVSPRIAQAISEETGAKVVLFNPAGNLKKEDFDNGVTFIGLMKENLDTLKTVLECHE